MPVTLETGRVSQTTGEVLRETVRLVGIIYDKHSTQRIPGSNEMVLIDATNPDATALRLKSSTLSEATNIVTEGSGPAEFRSGRYVMFIGHRNRVSKAA